MIRQRVAMLQDGGYTGLRFACTNLRAGAKVKKSQSRIYVVKRGHCMRAGGKGLGYFDWRGIALLLGLDALS